MLDRRAMLATTAAAALARPAIAAPGGGAAALNALFDQFMKENLDLSPTTATSLGLDVGPRASQKNGIDDTSLAGIAKSKAVTQSQLARLKAFDRATLPPHDAVSYDVVRYGLESTDNADRQFDYGEPGAGVPYIISQLSGNYCNVPSFLDNEHRVETRADAEAYLARLSGFAASMDQEIEVARHDIAKGVVPPDFALDKTLLQMNQLRAEAPEKSGLATSLSRRAAEKHIAGDWNSAAAKLVKEKIYPALDRQIALVKQMRTHAVHDGGVWRLPDGEAYYRASLRSWATTEKSPKEIHQLGLEMVAENGVKADAILKAQGMSKGSVGERLKAMAKEPRFLLPNTDAAKEKIIADLNSRVREVRAKLPQWFATLPKAEVVIKRVPKAIEAGQAAGYYQSPSLDGKRPGMYWINLRDTTELPTWTLSTLTYHESIPGHHLQLSLQQEASLPLIRRTSFYSGYIEGWAFYAEQLAVEMGMYDHDPLGHVGQLHDAMWRGVRLAVDTGMHAMKWSREQALRYYVDAVGDKESSAITEVERYCVWPGQACGYALGKLAFLAARQRAKAALGSKFDIRRFHDAVLLGGAVPLPLLDGLTAQYIAATRA